MNPNKTIKVRNAFKVDKSASNQNLIYERHDYMIENYLSLRKVDEPNNDEQDFAHMYGYC